MNSAKGYANNKKGHKFEDQMYELLVFMFGKDNVWKRIRIPFAKKLPMEHNVKKSVEIDLMISYRRKLYIIECKVRRGYTRKGLESNYFMPTADSQDLWFNGRKQTGMFLGNLWTAEKNIKYHRLYKACGNPEIQTVLLIDSKLKVDTESAPYAKCRNTYVITRIWFPNFLRYLQHHHGRVPQEIMGCPEENFTDGDYI